MHYLPRHIAITQFKQLSATPFPILQLSSQVEKSPAVPGDRYWTGNMIRQAYWSKAPENGEREFLSDKIPNQSSRKW